MDISFYHLTYQPLTVALPKLLTKVYETGMRAIIKAPSPTHVDEIDQVLWTFDKASFLPHDTEKNDHRENQPIYITSLDENPTSAEVLVLTDGATCEIMDGYKRILEMFDGNNPTSVSAARARWKSYKDAGHTLTYWQQNENGGWAQKG